MIDMKYFEKYDLRNLEPFIRFEKNRIVLSKKVYSTFKNKYVELMVNEKEEKIILIGKNYNDKIYTKKVGMYFGYGNYEFLNGFIGKKVKGNYYKESDCWLFDLKEVY